jgi:choline dehydrogenase
MNRPNLTVVTGALAHRIVIENGEAQGVLIETDGEMRPSPPSAK